MKNLTAQAYRGTGGGRTTSRTRSSSTQRGRKTGDFENGIRLALQSILVSPRFLFRLEQAPANGELKNASGDLSHQRSGSGVAAVVLPVGIGS